jgi:hypothetical protein
MALQFSKSSSPKTLEQMTQDVNKANKERETEIRGIMDDIIKMYQPGGAYGAGTEAELNRQKQKDVASATGSLVSSGLFGTTLTAGLPKKWEEEIGIPARMKLEDVRYGALTSALQAKAQFIENIQNEFPDYGMLSQLYAQGASAPTFSTSGSTFGKGVGPGASGISNVPSVQNNSMVNPVVNTTKQTSPTIPSSTPVSFSYGGYSTPEQYTAAQEESNPRGKYLDEYYGSF